MSVFFPHPYISPGPICSSFWQSRIFTEHSFNTIFQTSQFFLPTFFSVQLLHLLGINTRSQCIIFQKTILSPGKLAVDRSIHKLKTSSKISWFLTIFVVSILLLLIQLYYIFNLDVLLSICSYFSEYLHISFTANFLLPI